MGLHFSGLGSGGVGDWKVSNNKGLVLKLDFQKAYERFLNDVLKQIGFGDKQRKWIWGCISMVNFSILLMEDLKVRFGLKEVKRVASRRSTLSFPLHHRGRFLQSTSSVLCRKEIPSRNIGGVSKHCYFPSLIPNGMINFCMDSSKCMKIWCRLQLCSMNF